MAQLRELHHLLHQGLLKAEEIGAIYDVFPFPYFLRQYFASWIEEQKWGEVLLASTSEHLADGVSPVDKATQLMKTFLNFIDEEVQFCSQEESSLNNSLELYTARKKLQLEFESKPMEMVQVLSQLLEEEKKFITSVQEPESVEMEIPKEESVGESFPPKLQEVKEESLSFEHLCSEATGKLAVYNSLKAQLSDALTFVMPFEGPVNGEKTDFQKQYHQYTDEIKTKSLENLLSFLTIRQETLRTLYHLFSLLDDLIEDLLKEVTKWQKQQTLAYVRAAKEPDLANIESWCSDLGEYIWHTLKRTKKNEFQEVVYTSEDLINASDSELPHPASPEEVNQIHQKLQEMFSKLLQQTFLVSKQPPEVIKMAGTKKSGYSREFASGVRILGAGKLNIEQIAEKVTACFCSEADITEAKLKGKPVTSHYTMSGNTSEFTGHGRAVADFSEMKVQHFSRQDTEENRVCKQRYRLIFTTTITLQSHMKFDLEVMSLPVIVTTGSNQACEAHGSLLWYCYNCNVYDLHRAVPVELQWQVAVEMLSACISALGKRELKEDEKKFLGEKLTGKSLRNNPELKVSFNQFCVNRMMIKDKNVEFTFWKWFHAVLNLIRDYLLEPWTDGIIKGFVSKTNIKKTFKDQKSGTFLLRFSESCVSGDHQGVTGGLVVALKFKDFVTFSPPRTAQHLSKQSLSSLLKQFINAKTGEHLLQTLFPGGMSRERAFGKYIKTTGDKKGSGYYSGYPGWETFLGIDFSSLTLSDSTNNQMDDTEEYIDHDTSIWKVSAATSPTEVTYKQSTPLSPLEPEVFPTLGSTSATPSEAPKRVSWSRTKTQVRPGLGSEDPTQSSASNIPNMNLLIDTSQDMGLPVIPIDAANRLLKMTPAVQTSSLPSSSGFPGRAEAPTTSADKSLAFPMLSYSLTQPVRYPNAVSMRAQSPEAYGNQMLGSKGTRKRVGQLSTDSQSYQPCSKQPTTTENSPQTSVSHSVSSPEASCSSFSLSEGSPVAGNAENGGLENFATADSASPELNSLIPSIPAEWGESDDSLQQFQV